MSFGRQSQFTEKDRLRLQLAAQLASQFKAKDTGGIAERPRRTRVSRSSTIAKCILVVDDEPSVVELVSVALDGKGFRVIGAASVAEARVILQSRSDISLVITDLRMPEEDGFALLEFLRRNLRFHHIPSIVFTSCSDYRYVRKAIELGAQAYLAKPFSPQSLVERVTGVLQSSAINIVLVSDNCTCRNILGRVLTQGGHNVQTAGSGREALAIIKEGKVNLVISELVLEDMTGLEILERANDGSAGPPVLFISDPLLKVSEEAIQAVGGYGLIRKPFRNSEILRLIRSLERTLRSRCAAPR